MLRRVFNAIALAIAIGTIATPSAHSANSAVTWFVEYAGSPVTVEPGRLSTEVGDTILFRVEEVKIPAHTLVFVAAVVGSGNPFPDDGTCFKPPMQLVIAPGETFTATAPGEFSFWAVVDCGDGTVRRDDSRIDHTIDPLVITVNPPASVDELPTALVAPAIALAVFGALFVVRRRAAA